MSSESNNNKSMNKSTLTLKINLCYMLAILLTTIIIITGMCKVAINIIDSNFNNTAKNIDCLFKNTHDEISFMLNNAINKLNTNYSDKTLLSKALSETISQQHINIFHSIFWTNYKNKIKAIATYNQSTTNMINKKTNDIFMFNLKAEKNDFKIGGIVNNFLVDGARIIPVHTAISSNQNKYLGSLFLILDANKMCTLLRNTISTNYPYFIQEKSHNYPCILPLNKSRISINKEYRKWSKNIKQLNYISILKTLIIGTKYNYQYNTTSYPANLNLVIDRTLIVNVLHMEIQIAGILILMLVMASIVPLLLQQKIFLYFIATCVEFIQTFCDSNKNTTVHKSILKNLIYSITLLKKQTNKFKKRLNTAQKEYERAITQRDSAYLAAEMALVAQEEISAKIQKIELTNKITNAKYEYINEKLATYQQRADNILNLLADVNHELRTPLNSVIGFTDFILISTPLQQKTIEYLEYIKNCGHYLLYLVNDIIDIIRIEEGAITLEESNVAVNEVIISCISYLNSDINKKGIIINNYSVKKLPLLYVDKYRTRQIILNILANAIKYIGNGKIIDIYSYYKDKEGLNLIVRDNGSGISSNELNKIFSKYTRGESQQNIEGFGLGMSLIDKLVKMHNGKLNIESKLSIGTKITVTFPETRVIKDSKTVA
ncbi:hypothetical protein CAXC1_330060 [Candidatus Xenohaliotis californiensis]|uniref:histidine kinase n=1 Tax=Candidatus Xenohaliotis californiensis TaxID=84677 RepID=A0ABP0EWY4_9RICK|nr:hypothetical protein CAXC1_330060 [Candidatus Xenohaliotis californiensis]